MATRNVDEIPAVLRPIFLIGSSAVAMAFYLYVMLVHHTSDIRFSEHVPLERRNYIYCHWHTFVPLYLSVFTRHDRHAWLQHPHWYMKPIHLLLRWVGVERIVLGSSGHQGRNAADKLVTLLNEGYSTVVLPDGPAGPPFVLRKGVLHIAEQSGVPIVPVRFRGGGFRLPTWDKKSLPLPFGRIDVTFGEPMTIEPGADLTIAGETLVERLGDE